MHFSWRNTLERYLRCSSEDAAIISYFDRFIVPRLKEFINVDWIEIGPGPGTKTFGIYERLLAAGMKVRSAQAIEPDGAWLQKFQDRARQFDQTFPANPPFIFKNIGMEKLSTYISHDLLDCQSQVLITCLHVLYEETLAKMICSYLSQMPRYLASLIVEASSSDLWQLRWALNRKFQVPIPIAAEAEVRRTIANAGLICEEQLITDQQCKVDSRDIEEWFLLFLLGKTFCEDSLNEVPASKLISFIDDYLQRKGGVLEIPDIAFTLEKL